MSQHIGIVGGSAEGAALCYRTICIDGEGYGHPEVSMHTHSFADYMECVERDDWRGVGEIMLSSAHKLAAAGADFLICPDNTFHQALPYFRERSPLPWLHIAEVVLEHARERGYAKLGLTGTRWLVKSEVYPAELVRPNDDEREEISRIIMEELVRGIFRDEAVAYLSRVIQRMKDEGCDAVILGCTELPILMNDADAPLPLLDSTRLLARAARRRAGATAPGTTSR